jgi:hypothetical protein
LTAVIQWRHSTHRGQGHSRQTHSLQSAFLFYPRGSVVIIMQAAKGGAIFRTLEWPNRDDHNWWIYYWVITVQTLPLISFFFHVPDSKIRILWKSWMTQEFSNLVGRTK